jgi:hypothetical protein
VLVGVALGASVGKGVEVLGVAVGEFGVALALAVGAGVSAGLPVGAGVGPPQALSVIKPTSASARR